MQPTRILLPGPVPERLRARTDAATVRYLDPSARLRGRGRRRSRLIAPNRFVLQWVKERFAAGSRRSRAGAGAPVAIEFAVADAAIRPPRARRAPAARTHRPGRSAPAPAAPADSSSRAAVPAPGDRPRRRPRRRQSTHSLNPDVHVRDLRRRQGQPARAGGRHAGRRPPDLLQPAVRLRRRGPGQDAPDPGDRQPHPGARTRPPRSATSTPKPTFPTSCAPTSTRRSTTSSATTARSTCC